MSRRARDRDCGKLGGYRLDERRGVSERKPDVFVYLVLILVVVIVVVCIVVVVFVLHSLDDFLLLRGGTERLHETQDTAVRIAARDNIGGPREMRAACTLTR